MLFNSLIFLFFIAAFFILKPLFNKVHNNIRLLFLLLASLFFYGWWNPYYIFLLLFTGMVDFAGALAIVKWPDKRKLFLWLSLTSNLGVLFYFKYLLFFSETWSLLAGTQVPEDIIHHLALPIGISFYTFQSMSYTIDVYRGRMQPVSNPLLFFSFISFFPHLVAGPIVRPREILPQLMRVRLTNATERYNGLKLIVIGFFKKTVMADNLASFVYEAFGMQDIPSGFDYWWIATLAFTFQIYFDFSGYSDIARGLAKCVGIHFRMNFDHPYGAVSFKSFWTKWHISLSSWFRDYVYIALGGNTKGVLRGHINMWITMIVSGLWHGANFTFIVWGALHAFYLSLERLFKWPAFFSSFRFGHVVSAIFVFIGVVIGWVFFRANDLEQALTIISRLFDFSHRSALSTTDPYNNAVLFLKIAIVWEVLWVAGFRLKRILPAVVYRYAELFYLAVLIFCCLFFRGPGEQFIYFQF